MNTNLEEKLKNFVGEDENQDSSTNATPKVMLDSREGLIERVDKIFITKDGKQLLREQY